MMAARPRIAPRAHIAGMQAFPLADLSAPHGKRLISLAQNESAFPPSPAALEAARKALAEATLYPDTDWRDLRHAIAEVHELDPETILCSAGSMDLIGALTHAFAGPGDRVLSTAHGYGYFRTSALFAQAAYDAVPEPALTVSVDGLLGAVTPETRIVCVANPGNPTGTRISRSALLRLRDGLPDDVILLIDEAYAEFTDHLGEQMFDLVECGNTVVTRSFSKAHALAGMRIGWGVFPPEIGVHARKLLTPGGITVASLAAASAAMRDRNHVATIVRETATLRDRFLAQLEAIGIDAVPSHTNFVLLQFSDVDECCSANAALHAEAIIMRPMAGYGLPHCLRATIAPAADMDFTIKVLTAWKKGGAA